MRYNKKKKGVFCVKKMIILALISSFIILQACNQKIKNYHIPKGAHKSEWLPTLVHGNSISIKCQFSEGARYLLHNENQWDTNKLFGFSNSLWQNHHKNSARFGWRWNPTIAQVEIIGYTYFNKSRKIQVLDSLSIGEHFEGHITHRKGKYQFEGKNFKWETPAPATVSGWRWLLFPYFGGDEKAPHSMEIKLEYEVTDLRE